jgi:SAM-dependent methyltransferase
MNRAHRWLCRSRLWRNALTDTVLPWALDGVDLGESPLEVGPGPGLTTDVLRHRCRQVTAVEIDDELARALGARLAGTNVAVVGGDATRLPFGDQSFSGAVSFTMLHHVPSAELQDCLLREVCRVLQPGAAFAGSDSTWSVALRLLHVFDTMVLVDPGSFGARLETAGFTDVSVTVGRGAFRFRARRPRS